MSDFCFCLYKNVIYVIVSRWLGVLALSDQPVALVFIIMIILPTLSVGNFTSIFVKTATDLRVIFCMFPSSDKHSILSKNNLILVEKACFPDNHMTSHSLHSISFKPSLMQTFMNSSLFYLGLIKGNWLIDSAFIPFGLFWVRWA